MRRMPCRKCSICGRYSDLSVVVCKCGTDLGEISARLIDIEEIPQDQYGVINEEVSTYVRKCPVCGALNFTVDQNGTVMRCYQCHKKRIASVASVEYEDKGNDGNKEVTSESDSESKPDVKVASEGDARIRWQRDTRDNIAKILEKADSINKEHEEDVEIYDFPDVHDNEEKTKKNTATSRCNITLTAVGDAGFSFSVSAEPNKPYILGREANQGAFLSDDRYVGNEHCCLIFKNGFWYVKDNHTRNGTAVNSEDIGYNGERELKDGDELKLGHFSYSKAFRVTIE